jgi:localization factor PodJL
MATHTEILENAGEASDDDAVKMALGVRDEAKACSTTQLEHRLNALEKCFTELVQRCEKSLRERGGALSSVEEKMLALRNRLEQTEKHYAGAMMELRAELAQTAMRVKQGEASKTDSPDTATPLACSPEKGPAVEAVAAGTPELCKDELPSTSEAALEETPQEKISAATESYLAVARRAANAAAAQKEGHSAAGAPKLKRAGGARLAIVGCVAPIIILGAASLVLNRHTVAAKPTPAPAAHTAALVAPAQVALAPSVQTAATPAEVIASAPGNPTPAELASSTPLAELKQKADAGDAQAEREIGLKYLAGDGMAADEAEAARWLMSAAYKGEVSAEYWLGTLYARGHGLPADASQANHWYEAAAKQGHRRAMHNLGLNNFQGVGMEKNASQAAHWFEQAAGLGLPESQFNLAVLYERGTGVTQSVTAAYKWYAIAAAQGDKDANARVAALAKTMKPAELAAATQAAAGFKPATDATANAGGTARRAGGG